MTPLDASETVLRNIAVPMSMVSDAARFGGLRHRDCLQGDLVIRRGQVACMTPQGSVESANRMVMPKLAECHVHLDKCYTIARMDRIGGDLAAAIEVQAQDRAEWTATDIRTRAARGLRELIAAGCGQIRTHVDWGQGADDTAPSLAWHVLNEMAQDHQTYVNLDVAPLTSVSYLADSEVALSIGREVSKLGRTLGVFVLNQPEREAGIRNAFIVAAEMDLALDFHVDEGLAPGLDGLDIIASCAKETRFDGPILCGHACSLMNQTPEDLAPLADRLAETKITIAALPSSNLYLQGRTSGTPDRRGLTRIHELRAKGVSVVVGTDNVQDAFCPLGQHDPRISLSLAVLSAHLDPPFGQYLPMISTDAATAIGGKAVFIDGASVDDLLLFDVGTTADLLSDPTSPVPLATAFQGELV